MRTSLMAVALVVAGSAAGAQESVLMRRDFQKHLDSGYPVSWPKAGAPDTTPREFAGRGTKWDYVHRESGCWNDSACVEAIWPAGVGQHDAGWFWRGSMGPLDTSKPIYIRYRVRFLTPNFGAGNNKFFIWHLGGERDDRTPRLMLHHSLGNHSRVGCVSPAGAGNHVVVTLAENVGPDGGVGQDGWNCAGKALAINRWWNVQCSIQFGSKPRARCWFNNNDYEKPDDASANWTGPWEPKNANETMHDLGFLTDPPSSEVRWQWSHFEIAEAFDPTWCQDVSGVTCKEPRRRVTK